MWRVQATWFKLFLLLWILSLTIATTFAFRSATRSSSVARRAALGAVPPANMPMLALHGSGGTGSSLMETTLQHWMRHWKEEEDKELEVVTIDGPVPAKEDNGWSWWKLGPGERSFTADSYEGFAESRSLVQNALSKAQGKGQPFDVLFGHSQGAILITALLALQQIPYHPRLGYILNGVAWPNPFSLELESLRFSDAVEAPPPRILILMGDRDHINPPHSTGQRVVAALSRAGARVTVVTHPGGHAVPIPRADAESIAATTTWEAIVQWLRGTDV